VRADALRASGKEEDETADALDLARRIRDAMERLAGITRTAHNARTGSLLVEYEPGLVEPDAIVLLVAETAGLASPFDPAAQRFKGAPPSEIAIETVRELNAIVYELTGWRADLRAIVPASLAALGAYSFVVKKDDRLPRWDNLLYWSYNIFTQLHQREIRRKSEIAHARSETDASDASGKREPDR
jgi:hypothetical protein